MHLWRIPWIHASNIRTCIAYVHALQYNTLALHYIVSYFYSTILHHVTMHYTHAYTHNCITHVHTLHAYMQCMRTYIYTTWQEVIWHYMTSIHTSMHACVRVFHTCMHTRHTLTYMHCKQTWSTHTYATSHTYTWGDTTVNIHYTSLQYATLHPTYVSFNCKRARVHALTHNTHEVFSAPPSCGPHRTHSEARAHLHYVCLYKHEPGKGKCESETLYTNTSWCLLVNHTSTPQDATPTWKCNKQRMASPATHMLRFRLKIHRTV